MMVREIRGKSKCGGQVVGVERWGICWSARSWFIFNLIAPDLGSQPKAQDIRPRRDGHVLLALDLERHGRRLHPHVGFKPAQGLSILLIYCFESAVRLAVENYATARRQHTGP